MEVTFKEFYFIILKINSLDVFNMPLHIYRSITCIAAPHIFILIL